MKRILIALLVLVLIIPTTQAYAIAYDPALSYESMDVRFWEDEAPPIGYYINASSRYLLESVKEPRMGSTYGEWSVMDLLRAKYTGYDYINYIPDNYFEDYLTRINAYVVSKEGNLDRNKSTEWSRLTLSLTALGKNIQTVGEPGEYIKVVTAKEQNGQWLIESNNLASLSSIKIENQKISVKEPVGILTTSSDYFLLQPGEYQIKKDSNSLQLTKGSEKIQVPTSEYVNVTKPYNFVERMSQSHRFSYRQGINGPIWVLLAMNTGNYQLLDEATLKDMDVSIANGDIANSTGLMLDYILAREIKNSNNEIGGWALTGSLPDADITGMALQALAPYYLDENKFNATHSKIAYKEFKKAVERSVLTLKRIQKLNGGYDSWGSINSESIVQVVVALTALNMDPLKTIQLPTIGQTVSFKTDGAYIDGVWSDNMIDALLTFFANGSGSFPEVGGFKHVTAGYDGGGGSGTSVNAMATDQALYGLIAYDRFKKDENSLYDMTDMMNGEYKSMKAKKLTVTWVNGSKKSTTKLAPYALITLPDSAKAWNSKENLAGTQYLANEQLIMPEHDITLYADQHPTNDNKAAIQRVIKIIDALPTSKTISKDYKNQIDYAFTAYKKLSLNAQANVTNYAKLLELDGIINTLLSQYDDELKVLNLIQTIDSLTSVATISRDYEIAITNARVTYNDLSAIQRKQITNRKKLNELEAALTVSLEMDQGKAITVSTTQAAIDSLPTVNRVMLEHSTSIFKASAYLNSLTNQQQSTIANKDKLDALLTKIHSLQDSLLATEQFEDELDDDSYGKLTVIGNTLHVTAPRTTGTFQVRIAAKTLKNTLTSKVEKVIFSDERGVNLALDKQPLLNQLTNDKGELILQVSQLDYATQQFTVQWRLSTGDVLTSPNYMKLTIPYVYFINGKNLANRQLVKLVNTLPIATSHTATEKALTINLFAGASYQFIQNDLSFVDIKNSTDTTELLYLANRLIVNGLTDNTFGPNESVTRAQFAVMVNRVLGLEAKNASPFKDSTNQWYAKDVLALYESGIIKGSSPTLFNPNGQLTRQQVAIMMTRILSYVNYSVDNHTSGSAYKDQNKISKEAQQSVQVLKNLGIMSGANGYFDPTKPLTRLQMAQILKRTLAIAELL